MLIKIKAEQAENPDTERALVLNQKQNEKNTL
jgi:hypothetical protein